MHYLTPTRRITFFKRNNVGLWIEDMLDRGMPINEPNIKPRFSGRFVVRVPKTLHRLLAEESEREGISLNQFVNNSLAFVVGQKLAH